MPRKPRNVRPGTVYHLISRFVAREWFVETEQERRAYLTLLGESLVKSDWSCLGFAVMSNHVHLTTVAGEAPLDSWIREPHSQFAEWVNGRKERIGGLFVRGPTMKEVHAAEVGRTLAYLHNNPVRAGVTSQASSSTWTSHRAYLGLVKAPMWLAVDRGLELAGFAEPGAFDRFVDAMAREPSGDQLMARVIGAAAMLWNLEVAQCQRGRAPRAMDARSAIVHAAKRLGVETKTIAEGLAITRQAVEAIVKRPRTDDMVDRVAELVAEGLRPLLQRAVA